MVGSGDEVKRLVGGSNVQGVPAINAAQGDLSAGEQGPEQHAGGLGTRQQALRLDPALELLVQPLDGVRRPDRFPLIGRIEQEGEQVGSRLLKAGGDRRALQPPLAHERLSPGFDRLDRLGVDHVGVVGADLVVQLLWCMGKEVAMFMHRAPLNRHGGPEGGKGRLQARRTIDDQQVRGGELAGDQIVQEGAPRRFALAAHVV